MPPKGSKKSAEPTTLHEEVDLVSIDDILFPRATIQKSIRAILDNGDNDKMTLSKDSLLAIQRAATIFVSHLLFHARLFAKYSNRKNVYASDILAGLEHAGFAGFIPRVKQLLATYEEDVSLARKKKAEEKLSGSKSSTGEEPAVKKVKVSEEKMESTTGNEKDSAKDSEIAFKVKQRPYKKSSGRSGNDTASEGELDEDDDNIAVNAGNDAKEEAEDIEDIADEEDNDNEEVDATKNNPIALLNREQRELEGNDSAIDVEVVESDDDESS